jgi:ribosome maturation factor RimP
VSSPGLERPLRKIDDFRRFIGRKARVKFHDSRDGSKIFEGLLMNVEDDLVTMQIDGDQDQQFTLEDINKARLAI